LLHSTFQGLNLRVSPYKSLCSRSVCCSKAFEHVLKGGDYIRLYHSESNGIVEVARFAAFHTEPNCHCRLYGGDTS
jgi:hypothetical protein